MTRPKSPTSTGQLSEIEKIFENHEIFYLQKDWKTENDIPASDLPESQRPKTYRHLTSGNTTYGLVSHSGEVRLSVRFGDQTMIPREKIIPEILEKYARLVTDLDGSNVEYTHDTKFERSIDNVAKSLTDSRKKS